MGIIQDIQEWTKLFDDAPLEALVEKFEEEYEEWKESTYKDKLEVADMIIVLACICRRNGDSLELALREKHYINKQRTWKRNPSGNYSHE